MKGRRLVMIAAALVLAACADMSSTQQRTLSGATIGALGGAAIGSINGNAGWGAALGAAAGGAGGFIYDRHRLSQERAFQDGYAQGQASRR